MDVGSKTTRRAYRPRRYLRSTTTAAAVARFRGSFHFSARPRMHPPTYTSFTQYSTHAPLADDAD